MQITIKPYTSSDKPYFTKYFRGIYKYLEERDPYHKLAWNDVYSDFQADEELKNLEKDHARIFMAHEINTMYRNGCHIYTRQVTKCYQDAYTFC